jgi:hypothetical protein
LVVVVHQNAVRNTSLSFTKVKAVALDVLAVDRSTHAG